MLKLPAVVTREIDGFLPAADAVKRGLVAKESPEPVGTVGQPLGGEVIMQTGNGAEFTKSSEIDYAELRVKGDPVVAPEPDDEPQGRRRRYHEKDAVGPGLGQDRDLIAEPSTHPLPLNVH